MPGAFRVQLAALPQPGSVALRLCAGSGVARLTLRNAARRNALSGPMMAQLADAVDTLEEWRDGGAVVLEAEPSVSGARHFCAGADLQLVRSFLHTPGRGLDMSALMSETLERLRQLPLLSIGAIDGAAMGGGAELATATDWRVMAPDARLRFVQATLGVSTGWGGATRLSAIVGREAALRLLVLAPTVLADEAAALGLADAVCAPDEPAADASLALARAVLGNAGSVGAVRALKAAVAAAGAAPRDARDAESAAFGAVWGAEPHLRLLDRVSKG